MDNIVTDLGMELQGYRKYKDIQSIGGMRVLCASFLALADRLDDKNITRR